MKVAKTVVLLAVLVLFGSSAEAATYDCNGGGRYEDMGDGTVTDCRTGMIWLKNAQCTDTANGIVNTSGQLTWNDAMNWVAGLSNGICGLNDGSFVGDWRLPTRTEWMAMVAYAKKSGYTNPALTNDLASGKWGTGGTSSFTNVQSDVYWSSTTAAWDIGSASFVYMGNGSMNYDFKSGSHYVWPVRGGQSASFGSLIIQ